MMEDLDGCDMIAISINTSSAKVGMIEIVHTRETILFK